VLDTSALIMGLDPLGLEFDSYSVPEVSGELRQQTGPSYRLSVSASSGKLKIQTPSKLSLVEVSDKAKLLGDKVVLSGTDTSILALALDLRRGGATPIIVSDDYAVQNVAEALNLNYQSLATFGIREKFNWVFYCPACFRTYRTGDARDCPVCGTKLKRKPLDKEIAKQRSS
jgi:UPF0271 protein